MFVTETHFKLINVMRQYITVIFMLIGLTGMSQQPVKKPLTFDDYNSWKTLVNKQISDNGKVISYEVNPQKGDGILVVHHSGRIDSLKRGADAQISPEENYIVFKIKQPEDSIRKAKIDKVKKENMPADSLGIFVFKHDSVVVYPEIKSFKIPEEDGNWIALTLKATELKDTTKTKEKKKKDKQPGDDLVLFNTTNADTTVFRNVTEFFYSKPGNNILLISQMEDSVNTWSKIRMFDTKTATVKTVFDEQGWAKKIISDETGSQYGFLYSADTIKEKIYKLYYGTVEETNPEMIVDSYTSGIPIGWSPSENGRIWFSEDGTKLYFCTAESPEHAPKDTIPEDEKPKLDIWNWKDLTLQPQQKLEAAEEKKRTYQAVFFTETHKYIQLADVNIKNVSTILKGDADIALGSDETPYLRASSWTGENNRDYYLIDLRSGIKNQVLTDQSYVRLSPAGKYLIWYNDSDSSYYAKSTGREKKDTIALTKKIPVSFYDERHDSPSDPRPYGVAGWADDDRFVFIYDRYDIWKIDPTGEKVPVNISKAFGRRNNTRLRYVRLDREEEFIPTDKSIILSAFDERTMSSGYFKTTFNAVKDPKLLLVDKYSFSTPVKAKKADKIIWTKEDVKTFPDLWVSDLDFGQAERLSDANPQQKNYIWATVELVEWTTFTGETLQGLLYKPEYFNPDKKYPMIVYFYERSSETMHSHYIPYPSRSTINRTFYPSNGYLVFIPDITYKTGYPGQSAYNAIVSGVNYLINTFPFVDKEKMGLQGQSWGGYQTVYLITQTDMFAAAMGGAPVSNMTSAYGGIRWGSGMSRMFQYEHTQSRIGGTLWEKPLLYIENSPVFHAPKINTPLLMMHNDDDGAVPWYQGIEMFVAMRRLNKPAWMLSYNGEPHNLNATSWANRVDLSKRMFQFFNHYLKGKPMPEWMEKGVPAIEKGENLGY
ncbi:MAG: S9 family peptidase [Prolixibacteraceae bacterium]|nr:S9 family peptidase [Prolixibacteraceae bacterium]MBN2772844.1 S9 family peptidase [Prolixibacteraceae bacterium]